MLQLIFFSVLFAVLASVCFLQLHLGFLSAVALVPLFGAILRNGTTDGHVPGRERPARASGGHDKRPLHDGTPWGWGDAWRELKCGFGRGWLAGVLFFGITFYWIPFLPAENVTVPFLMLPAYLVMAAYLALYMGVFGALLRLVHARVTTRLVLTAPFIWLVAELLRARGLLGFPWASLGYALYEYPEFIQFASFCSVYGVSFALVLVNALIYDSFASRKMRRVTAVVAACCIVAAAGIFGTVTMRGAGTARVAGGDVAAGYKGSGAAPAAGELKVGLVQPNMSSSIKWDPRFRAHNLQILLELTEKLGRERPDLIIWPETATPFYLRHEPAYLELLLRTLNRLNVPLLIGFPDALPKDNEYVYYNSAGLLVPRWGLVQKYNKVHLVPFGERIPYDDVFTFLKNVELGEADFERGDTYTVFKLGTEPETPVRPEARGATFSVLVCFESIFPELIRSFKRNDAQFLVNITNDEWFGRTAAPHQHAHMAVFRAVETRSSIARCANTGISMLIDPWGRITLQSGLFTREALVGTIKLVPGGTFFTKHGFLLLWPLVGVAALEVAGAFVWRKQRRPPVEGREWV
ncbi:MAG: apolipoprotein N-acyltransferase [Candidatus Eisenbacteria bacterium]|nr:apolipoprotein N-acyltransferase [Candidatus Eisenbacteria bacterium]